MMSENLETTYNPKAIESKLYEKWCEKKYFHAEVDRDKKPFTIVMPPPNITGKLHMGHALDNTLQDVLIRYKRMQGYNALWVPGTDHAAISTEVKVTNQLKDEGIDKKELGREKFLERTWEWKEEYGGTITEQLKKIGTSCDWDRERFTMDEGCSKAVEEVFIKLYEEGYITKAPELSTGVRYVRLPFLMQRLSMRSRTEASGISNIQSLEQMTTLRSQQLVRRLCLAILRLQYIRMMRDTKIS